MLGTGLYEFAKQNFPRNWLIWKLGGKTIVEYHDLENTLHCKEMLLNIERERLAMLKRKYDDLELRLDDTHTNPSMKSYRTRRDGDTK